MFSRSLVLMDMRSCVALFLSSSFCFCVHLRLCMCLCLCLSMPLSKCTFARARACPRMLHGARACVVAPMRVDPAD